MNDFKFGLGQPVQLALSGEKGVVIGRSEYTTRPPMYMVRYVAADGRQVEGWEDAEALQDQE